MGFDLECLGKPTKRTNRWIASAPLEVADVTALHFGVEGELLLCHAPELTIAPDIFAKKLDRIHNGMWPQASGNVCRSEEHTSELQSLMRISYAVFCLKKKTKIKTQIQQH